MDKKRRITKWRKGNRDAFIRDMEDTVESDDIAKDLADGLVNKVNRANAVLEIMSNPQKRLEHIQKEWGGTLQALADSDNKWTHGEYMGLLYLYREKLGGERMSRTHLEQWRYREYLLENREGSPGRLEDQELAESLFTKLSSDVLTLLNQYPIEVVADRVDLINAYLVRLGMPRESIARFMAQRKVD